MHVCVELPAGPLIEYLGFCMAIAEAVCPTNECHYQNIECIVNKMVTHRVSVRPNTKKEKWPASMALQMVLPSDGGRTVDQLHPGDADADRTNPSQLSLDPSDRHQMVEVTLPYRLDDADRRVLTKVLLTLPSLKYPIADNDQAAFLDAWFSLKDRPDWEPVLVTDRYIEQRKAAQSAVLEEHQAALQKEFESGGMQALNANYVPVAALTTGSFIPRNQAIAYLERCGLAQGGDEVDAAIQDDLQSVQPKREVVSAATPPAEGSKDSAALAVPPARRGASTVDQGGKPEVAKPTGASVHPEANVPRRGAKVARLKRVSELTGLGRSSIYNRMDPRSAYYDPSFPRSFPLGSTTGSAVGWSEEEIQAWVAAQAANARE